MAEINLEDLMKNKGQSKESTEVTVVPEKEIETVTQQVEKLRAAVGSLA